jgi:hypothetical protein
VPDPARHADLPDRAENHILRGHTERQLPDEPEPHRLRLALREGLGREHVLDLGRPDPERKRPEGAVRRGVAVAADDRHAGLRDPELRADDVDDALPAAAGRVEGDAELLAVSPQSVELGPRERVADRPLLGGDVVVHRRDGEVGAPHAATCQPQALEGLRRGHLVDEVQIHVEQSRLARRLRHDMALPDAVEQRFRHL